MLKTSEIIFGHEYFCVGGVTIKGVIGIRDYPSNMTVDKADRKTDGEHTRKR